MSRAPRSTEAKRDWGEDDTGCHVLHVDMDAFFAAVEVMDDPRLAGRAVVVGGRERGVVAAASYEARRYGVRSAMPMREALGRCPHAIVVPPRRERYVAVSRQVMTILADLTPLVERVSIDEAFLDVAGAVRRLGPPTSIGRHLRERVRREVGVTASVGVATTKLVAKLASTHAKPDGLLLIPAAATVGFLRLLPVGALPGVGEKTADVLDGLGIRTVADLADTPVGRLERSLGAAHARGLHALAHGVDPRPVTVDRAEKSVGTETTFRTDVRDRADLERTLLRQAHETAARLRLEGLGASTVTIKVRHHDFTTLTRSRGLGAPTSLARDLHAAAKSLLDAQAIPAGGIRLLGLRAESLVTVADTGVQLGLGDEGDTQRIEAAMDAVARRFGARALAPASLLARADGRGPEREGPDGAQDPARHPGPGGPPATGAPLPLADDDPYS